MLRGDVNKVNTDTNTCTSTIFNKCFNIKKNQNLLYRSQPKAKTAML